MFRIGQRFYDERNGRYLTIDGVGSDPKCYRCIQEEVNDNDELETTDTVLMMQCELSKMMEA